MEQIIAADLHLKFKEKQDAQKDIIYKIFKDDPGLVKSIPFIKDQIRSLAKERDSLKNYLSKLQKEEETLDIKLTQLKNNLSKMDSILLELEPEKKQDLKKKLMLQYEMEQGKGHADSKNLTMLSGLFLILLFLQLGSLFVL
jgi:chromosome segregation ATPase